MQDPILHIENLSVHYAGRAALTEICLDVKEKEYLGIIGPNGGGKSTLLKAILGLIPLSQGEIDLFGDAPEKERQKIGYVPQISSLDRHFPATVFEVILSGRLTRGLHPFFHYSKADEEAVERIVERLGISSFCRRRISELSGGEFQKMLLARALVCGPQLLLLDEPTASVDASSRIEIYRLLEELNQEITILLVTHDLFAVSSAVSQIACLNERLVYHGEPELSNEIVTKLYGCPVDLIAHGVPHRVLQHHGEECES